MVPGQVIACNIPTFMQSLMFILKSCSLYICFDNYLQSYRVIGGKIWQQHDKVDEDN